MNGFIGTYNDNGIYSFNIEMKTGAVSNVRKFSDVSNSKYLKLTDKYIYSIITKENKAGVAVLDKSGVILSELLFENIASCYIEVVDDKYIYTANYHEGTVSKMLFENNEIMLCEQRKIKEKAGCHQIIKNNDLLYIPCLNMDEIIVLDLNLRVLDTIFLAKATGPRHGVINGEYLYIVTENSNQLFKIDISTDKVVEVLILTSSEVAKSSAIRLSDCKNYLFVAVRNLNLVYKILINKCDMEIESEMSTFGEETRDIVSLYDKYLLVVNQYSNEVISMSIENKEEINRIKVPECAVIVVGEENGN